MSEDLLHPVAPGVPTECPRCGRTFEGPIQVEIEGEMKRLPGHVQGGPLCIPLPTLEYGDRDVRVRKARRRGNR